MSEADAIPADAGDEWTDEALTTRLREHGLVGPISAEFLAEYRQDVRFSSLAQRLDALSGGQEFFGRTMVRGGIFRAPDPGDVKLLDAWTRWKRARASINASGADAPDEVDAPFWREVEQAEDEILDAVATTKAGAIVKLRLALSVMGPRHAWFDRALSLGDDTSLFGRSPEMDLESRLVTDALEMLAFEAPPAAAAAERVE